MVYFVLALWLFRGPNCGYAYVLGKLVDGLYHRRRAQELLVGTLDPDGWVDAGGGRRWRPPNISSLARARTRLGADPLHMLFDAVAGPTGAVDTAGAEGRWTAVARSAERYADGPAFLVGDAAHQVPLAGATGVSTALADVHNLAWKLAAVLDGRAAEVLLDTYRAEREAVGRRAVAEARAAWEVTRNPSAIPFAGRSLRQIDMGYRYASAAVIDDGSLDAGGPGDYVPLADPGCRAPHLRLDGGARSTLDLFGREFVLLTAPEGEPGRAGGRAGGGGRTMCRSRSGPSCTAPGRAGPCWCVPTGTWRGAAGAERAARLDVSGFDPRRPDRPGVRIHAGSGG